MATKLLLTAAAVVGLGVVGVLGGCSSSSTNSSPDAGGGGSSSGGTTSSSGGTTSSSSGAGSSSSSSGAGSSSSSSGAGTSSGGSSSGSVGPDPLLISDMESGTNGPLNFNPGAGLHAGYWFDDVNNVNTQDQITFPNQCDGQTSSVSPGCVGFAFTPLSPARGTSTKGIHITCTLVTQYAGCEVAFEFAQQDTGDGGPTTLADGGVGPAARNTVVYDITKYSGLHFWVMTGAAHNAYALLVKVPNNDTDPRGSKCTTCYDDFAYPITVSAPTTWTEVTAPFALLTQGQWGVPQAATFDTTTVYGVNFAAKGPQAGPDAGGTTMTADYWIDDVSFTQ